MRMLLKSAILLTALTSLTGHAENINGTWRYEKSMDYFSQMKLTEMKAPIIQIINNVAKISPNCNVALTKSHYLYSSPFQSLLKQDVTERMLENYLKKNFSFSIMGAKDYLRADIDETCNGPVRDFLVSGDKLLTPFAGSAFHSYARVDDGALRRVEAKLAIGDRKLSQLPFDPGTFISLCHGLRPLVRGVPQTTDRCAPVYYPYIATKKNSDSLARLIGMHDYRKGGASYADDYAPPFANELHPTFVLLPPLKEALVVRVQDLEGSAEDRDMMSGVYLVIKDGKVSDQLNDGCTIDERYVCTDDDGKKRYQLLESGKFKKLF